MKRRDFLALAAATAAYPRLTLAQQAARVPRVALCSMGIPTSAMVLGGDPNVSAFLDQMAGHGFVEGRTINYERYLAPAPTAADVARSIVDTKPDLIFFEGAVSAALVARQITRPFRWLRFNPMWSARASLTILLTRKAT
jgi:hypothetical protein